MLNVGESSGVRACSGSPGIRKSDGNVAALRSRDWYSTYYEAVRWSLEVWSLEGFLGG